MLVFDLQVFDMWVFGRVVFVMLVFDLCDVWYMIAWSVGV